MGYYIQMNGEIKIHLNKEADLWKAFQHLQDTCPERGRGGSWGGGVKKEVWYSWISKDFAEKDTIEEVFQEWEFECVRDGDYFVISRDYNNKIGQENELFKDIAPLVESGEFEVRGEDDALWKWVFKNGKCYEVTGSISYDEELSTPL